MKKEMESAVKQNTPKSKVTGEKCGLGMRLQGYCLFQVLDQSSDIVPIVATQHLLMMP